MDDVTNQVREKVKVCPQCQASFVCKPENCWCSNLPAKIPMFDNGSCYCLKCLEEIVAKKMNTPM